MERLATIQPPTPFPAAHKADLKLPTITGVDMRTIERMGGAVPDITKRKRLGNEVKILRGLIRVCAWCHQALDDNGLWVSLESYSKLYPEASFT
jgi:hypothetical protein